MIMATPRRTQRVSEKTAPAKDEVEQPAPTEAVPSEPPAGPTAAQVSLQSQQEADARRGVAQFLVDGGWKIVNAGQQGDTHWFDVEKESGGARITKRVEVGDDGQPRWLT